MRNIERRRRLTSNQWSPSVRELIIVCVIGIGMIFVAQRMRTASSASSQQMRVAAETMASATTTLAAHRSEFGPAIDLSTDINATGLIGSFFTDMTTTTGNLEAKRTSTNPNMASVLVYLLQEVGVRPGDFIAVGASGSFPALILAAESAAQALDLQMGLILSLGSSQFGANNLEFTWFEMARILAEEGIVAGDVLAASLGGDLDIARDLGAEVRASLTEKIDESAALFIHEPNLEENVNRRMSIYRMAAGDKPISVLINIGGAWANMGVDASILTASPGVIHPDSLPDESSRGVIHAMVAEGVPVIHLLNMKELAQRHGIPWDPSPLPKPGDSLAVSASEVASQYWIMPLVLTMAMLWLVSVALRRRIRKRKSVATAA